MFYPKHDLWCPCIDALPVIDKQTGTFNPGLLHIYYYVIMDIYHCWLANHLRLQLVYVLVPLQDVTNLHCYVTLDHNRTTIRSSINMGSYLLWIYTPIINSDVINQWNIGIHV